MKTKNLRMVFSSLIVLSRHAGCAKNEKTSIISSTEALLTESSKQPP